MSEESPNKAMLWGGRVASALPVMAFLASSGMKLAHGAEFVAQFTGHMGYPESTIMPIGVVEMLCAIIYAVPQTSVLGAILLTGYLGGATATHVRVGESPAAAIILGVIVWGGLFLRDARIRALIPIRQKSE